MPSIPGISSGELKKFKIEAFDKTSRQGAPKKTFEVMYNPNSYSNRIQVNYTPIIEPGGDSRKHVFINVGKQDYQFEFLIDGTGASDPGNILGIGNAIPGGSALQPPVSVEKKIEEFMQVCFDTKGKIHRPWFLKLTWGKLVSDCVLTSADISYTLFKPDGSPLRAKIKATFSASKDPKLIELIKNNSSPDLTHIRVVGESLNLPLMSSEIYNSPDYYIQVARHNRLKHFRRLKTGQELQFPPLKNENE
ncbi:MAG: hypothetical protein R3C61_12580 [Bacteroidia bacterium]